MNRIQSLDKNNQLSEPYEPHKNYSKTINYIRSPSGPHKNYISPPGLERRLENQNN